ncbi:MAG: EVE domain-containing protein [Calditrichaeota bacterium]|nr:EVE domain-containing protein [Calditrichota bacterium]
MNYWLMKTEPETFSIDDLKARPNQTEHWDGVRNFQARNHMKEMKLGDQVLFYHSSTTHIGVAGIAEVVTEAYPDHTQFDPKSKYFYPKSSKEKPYWYMVNVKFKQKFNEIVSLETIKQTKGLEDMRLIRRGNRLSVMPVEESEFKIIAKIGQE